MRVNLGRGEEGKLKLKGAVLGLEGLDPRRPQRAFWGSKRDSGEHAFKLFGGALAVASGLLQLAG